MAEVNIDVAKEESVQAVNTKVGTSSDTASSTPTTLFAGIKGLIAWFTGTWTAARAAKIDTIDTISTNTAYSATASSTGSLSQKMAYIISTLIGVTNATGGTSTAGTAMAKLNAILTWFTETWTTTRAGYIDNCRSYTVTNNTASTTGVLSQKMSAVIEKRYVSTTGTGATAFSYATVFSVGTPYYCVGKFIAPISGIYTADISFVANTSSTYGNVRAIKVYKLDPSIDPASPTPLWKNYMNASVAAAFASSVSNTFTEFISISSANTVASSGSGTFYCEEGETVVLLVGVPGNSDNSGAAYKFASFGATYQPRYN